MFGSALWRVTVEGKGSRVMTVSFGVKLAGLETQFWHSFPGLVADL